MENEKLSNENIKSRSNELESVYPDFKLEK